MKTVTVMVTGVGGGGHGEQIFKALRLSDMHYRIVAADMAPQSKALFLADKAYLLPRANHPHYLESLLDICRQEDVKALFHGSEPELRVFAENRKRIEAQGLFLPINTTEVIRRCMNKGATCAFLRDHGFAYPQFLTLRRVEDTIGFSKFPAVIKPSLGSGGSADAFIIQNKEELDFYARAMLSFHDECILQEYVGTHQDEYTVGVLTDMDGGLLHSIAVKRSILSALSNRMKIPNRTGRADLGPVLALSSGISQGEIGPFPEVTRQCEDIALALGSRGPLNIQCRLVGGTVYVFEINPRFSGTTSLRAMAGFNEPDLLVRRHVLGQPVQPGFPYARGIITRGLDEFFFRQTDERCIDESFLPKGGNDA